MKAFGAAWQQQFPHATSNNKRAITDGDLALLHSQPSPSPSRRGSPRFEGPQHQGNA
jgi:hypothetical protein